MARPSNANRQAALADGAAHYIGGPCRAGHSGKRYASTGACVDCNMERDRKRRLTVAVDPATDSHWESLFS